MRVAMGHARTERKVMSLQAYVNGRKPKTKKALRDALAADPSSVWFEDTSYINNRGTLTAEQLSPSDVIVGPDAQTTRSWYANIRNGKVV